MADCRRDDIMIIIIRKHHFYTCTRVYKMCIYIYIKLYLCETRGIMSVAAVEMTKRKQKQKSNKKKT